MKNDTKPQETKQYLPPQVEDIIIQTEQGFCLSGNNENYSLEEGIW